ncbi:kynureninase [Amycolatopsis xylanica]|uniref:Kynureninase n=1 Tax=Amycolatopsis xylanica TaxID=589385 RepID=A0A1H3DE23_9PSEU|nr:kynureninase [Amycolatopsis xylanica]SDX64607.1 kynureninase [Amycolatopsis xylanica]
MSAADLDARDPLAGIRAEFDLDPAVSYLDGNSLGAPPRRVADRLDDVIRKQWAGRLIQAWDDGWWDAPERIGDRIGPLIGAAAGQTVVCDSTSVNLFKALAAAVRLQPGRDEILVDARTFPSDGYIADGLAGFTGHTVRRVDPVDMPAAASERTAAAVVNHVDYVTGRLHDMPAITDGLHAVGALAVWDLCHSVGVLPIQLDGCGVDFAVGCTYKFLNGGPGAPAFIYVARKWLDRFEHPLTGWAGHRDPFAMSSDYTGSAGIGRARAGTPDILAMSAVDAALDIWDLVSIEDVRAKGLALGDFFFECLDELLPSASVLTPRDPARGHQVSVAGTAAQLKALAGRGIIGDFRPPNVLRFGLAPLYTRYVDVERAVHGLVSVQTG